MTAENAVLQVGPLMPMVQTAITRDHDAVELPDGPNRSAFLAEHAESVTVAVTSGRTGVGPELMSALPNLRAVINFGVGYDTTDITQAAERGIAVSNTPDVLNDCVADTALALYLDVLRRITAADRFVRRGDWTTTGNFPLTTQASHRQVGIVGLGRIGSVIARRLEGFDCTIRYHNRSEVTGSPYEYLPSLRELAHVSDVLIVAAAGGASTHHLVGQSELDALGPQGYLINVSRGSVVDEAALVRALTAGDLAGAGLDVFEDEPTVPRELLDLESVVLLPHLGSGTHETRAAMAELTLKNLRQFLAVGSLLTPVI
ncbi:2-hydroxyacid dehydrogenase [Arthrobacter sp. B0490]|uniref:2-hydroxyacid dehydrogenase n=1 Tax=Arthrobacter sp. B0490 TaxID=2058891 RepID=UPI000CE4AF63|nr:2-hydroxyacid dehydrogenase [Arthrobacter sp. B0490]